MEDDELVRLNIGGKRFTTTKTTLLSRGQNFFSPLLKGKIKSHKDETGAYFIDRNGSHFQPILDYLRDGELIVPPKMKLSAILKEADFYSIDVVPGLCGNIKEGLYTSSNWIIFLERDTSHPWIFGITGVEDDSPRDTKNLFFKQVCTVDDSTLRWQYNDVLYEIYAQDDKVFIWNPNSFNSRNQLFFRCPNSKKFPLEVSEVLASDKTFEGSSLVLTFSTTPKGAIQARTDHPANLLEPIFSDVEVLCRRLLIMHMAEDEKKSDKLGEKIEPKEGNYRKKKRRLVALFAL